MITVHNLVKTYSSAAGDVRALKGVSFEVARGEFFAITGRSGSGKSTLLYQLGLLDNPTAGRIHIDGVNILELSPQERTAFRLHELGYIFQDYAVLPILTATENVMVPLLMQGLSAEEAGIKARAALEAVGLAGQLHNLPSQLSGGEQQRVSIARAIAHAPKIIFADEPTANLDSETSRAVLEVFLALHRQGQTMVMVTHEDEYAALADRVITLSDGEIAADVRNKKE